VRLIESLGHEPEIGQDHDCSRYPTGLNGTQCVPDGALVCTSTHLVDGKDLGVQEKSPGWSEVTHYVRIVEVAGSSPVTSTSQKRVWAGQGP